ncbi:MAG: ATP synthase F1 subunit delta [Nitrospirae bacterium]|nr:ATP synthase F1 subunit delta [Nitrospirota bacterium]
MKKVKGVKRYAKQFLSAVDLTEASQGIEQLSAIAALMEKEKSFRNLMVSPIFSADESRQVIAYMSRKLRMSEKTAKYLQYLSESRAIGSLPEIIKAIVEQYLEMKKRAKAVVTSPVQIGKDYEAKLTGSLKQITGRDIDLEFVVDPSLLGGIRIKIGSTMYDSSIKGQLGLLKDKLIKG